MRTKTSPFCPQSWGPGHMVQPGKVRTKRSLFCPQSWGRRSQGPTRQGEDKNITFLSAILGSKATWSNPARRGQHDHFFVRNLGVEGHRVQPGRVRTNTSPFCPQSMTKTSPFCPQSWGPRPHGPTRQGADKTISFLSAILGSKVTGSNPAG